MTMWPVNASAYQTRPVGWVESPLLERSQAPPPG
jgi:hypothetical protein